VEILETAAPPSGASAIWRRSLALAAISSPIREAMGGPVYVGQTGTTHAIIARAVWPQQEQ
jgi:hypothetical protein